jgi:hypothetical protein
MEILRKNIDQNIILSSDSSFKTDLGWTEGAEQMDKEILYSIINPTENYETVRYIHHPYTSTTTNVLQTDIWYSFFFLNGVSYTQNYEVVGISLTENAKMLKQSTESFFRLEFYKTSNDEPPLQTNRRLVFAKNLTLPLGEKIFYTGTTATSIIPLNDYIYFPVFMGSNYKNTENMYFFWFADDSPFDETNLTGNTFYMTAKFYNADDGSVTDFVNKSLSVGQSVIEQNDLYYKVIIDRTDFSYQVFRFNGVSPGSRVGESNDTIIFYERRQ